MSSPEMAGSSDCLTGMPGDILHFKSDEGVVEQGIVRVAGWQPSPKGGKVWTYETISGDLVPNTSVIKVEKVPGKLNCEDSKKSVFDDHSDFMKALEALEMSAILKTIIFCVISGDAKNLEVAKFLIERRLSELKILTDSLTPIAPKSMGANIP